MDISTMHVFLYIISVFPRAAVLTDIPTSNIKYYTIFSVGEYEIQL